MTMHESDFAGKITGYLDAGAAEIKAGTAYKLQLARQEALARLAESEPVVVLSLTPALAGAGGGLSSGPARSSWRRPRLKLWLAVLAIIAVSLGYQQWQAYQQLNDLEETDAGILSSDLPIDAYLDRGFQNWLKHDSD